MEKNWESSTDSVEYSPGRNIFLILLIVCTLVIVAGGFFFWYVPTVGLNAIHPVLPYVLGAIFASLGIFVVGGGIGIFFSILTGRATFLSGPFRWLLLKVYMPLMLTAGKLLHISKIKIERAFLDINNQMVLAMRAGLNPERLLILMPHCIQFEDCKIKVTKEVTNCVSCGKCEIADLLSIQDEFGIKLFRLNRRDSSQKKGSRTKAARGCGRGLRKRSRQRRPGRLSAAGLRHCQQEADGLLHRDGCVDGGCKRGGRQVLKLAPLYAALVSCHDAALTPPI